MFLLCEERFRNNIDIPLSDHFYQEVQRNLTFLHGNIALSGSYGVHPREDVIPFLFDCKDEHYLDFIEFIFPVQVRLAVPFDSRIRTDEINLFFEMDDIAYRLTEEVWNTNSQSLGLDEIPLPYSLFDKPQRYPQVISQDSEVLHQEAVGPALSLLRQSAFENADKEFMDALQDFRRGDYQDCVRKCGDALESAMKIICGKKKWKYPQTADGIKMLNIIIPKTDLDSHYNKLMQLVTIIRNNCAHGAGEVARVVPRHEAQFMINATASAILLLVEETDAL